MPYRFLSTIVLLAFFACVPSDEQMDSPVDGPVPDAGTVDLEREEILRGYNQEVWEFAQARMNGDWWAWMLPNSTCADPTQPPSLACPYAWYQNAYVRARRADPAFRRLRIEVGYETPIAYDPPWSNEEEHLQAIKLMAELSFPGWEFILSFDDPRAEFRVILGHASGSFVDHETIYLAQESVFSHEFGHLLGLSHHYCVAGDDCKRNHPPGEGPCIMSRESLSWGPTEQFLLQLGPYRFDDEIAAAADEIMRRYPMNRSLAVD